MRLGELVGKILTCNASITITGFCEEYRGGVDSLLKEPWYEEAQDRLVNGVSIFGYDERSFELVIRI